MEHNIIIDEHTGECGEELSTLRYRGLSTTNNRTMVRTSILTNKCLFIASTALSMAIFIHSPLSPINCLSFLMHMQLTFKKKMRHIRLGILSNK